MKLSLNKTTLGGVLLLLVFLAQADTYRYAELMSMRPQSTHVWRQTDCASFALNYYQNGLNPFHVRLHNEFDTQGVTLGEGPFLYYLVALGYATFGYDEAVYRGFWILLLFLGLLALFRLTLKMTASLFWSVFIPTLVFTIPVIVYYGNNFLPNVPALAMVFMAWYYFYRFEETDSRKHLWSAALLFLIAGWEKAPAMISFLALLGAGSMYLVFFQKQPIRKVLKRYWVLMIPLVFVMGWYAFSGWYASHGGSDYLSAKLFPFWQLSDAQIADTLDTVKNLWRFEYFNALSFKLYLGLGIVCAPFLFHPKLRFFGLLVLVTTIGIALYAFIFFVAFRDHDYYTINAFVLVPMIALFFVRVVQEQRVPIWGRVAFKALGIYILYHATLYAGERQALRYDDWPNLLHVNRDLFDLEPQLRAAGIHHTDKVISVPDLTTNQSLYYMNQYGYSNFNALHIHPDTVDQLITKGVQYIVVNDTQEVNKAYIKPHIGEEVLRHKGVKVFTALP